MKNKIVFCLLIFLYFNNCFQYHYIFNKKDKISIRKKFIIYSLFNGYSKKEITFSEHCDGKRIIGITLNQDLKSAILCVLTLATYCPKTGEVECAEN